MSGKDQYTIQNPATKGSAGYSLEKFLLLGATLLLAAPLRIPMLIRLPMWLVVIYLRRRPLLKTRR